jgi:hypothetical protein
MLYRVHLAGAEFELTTLVVIGTDCIGIYKSNYHKGTIKTIYFYILHTANPIWTPSQDKGSIVFSVTTESLEAILAEMVIGWFSIMSSSKT